MWLVLAVGALSCTGAEAAQAAARFAAPTGTGALPCTETQPNECSIQTALGTGADDVTLEPGTYTVAAFLFVKAGVDVHGRAGQPRPTVTGGDAFGVFDVKPGGTVRDLDIVGSATGISLEGGLLERAIVRVTGGGGIGCSLLGASTVRDTVCWTSAGNAKAVGLNGSGYIFTATLRNVTAVATGSPSFGIGIDDGGSGSVNLNGTNVIASGRSADVRAAGTGAPPSTVIITLDHSDYATEQEMGAGTVTNPGSGTNITGAPAFVNAPNGDFRPATGSPTIDAGVDDPLNGPLDVLGAPRTQGLRTDIGAHEFSPPAVNPTPTTDVIPPGVTAPPPGPPPPARDVTAPDTIRGKGPAKRTAKRRAKFSFSSTEPGSRFRCALDKRPFAPCKPGLTVKVKLGKHTFNAAAVDPAGNVDPTPGVFRWKVVPSR